MRLRGPHLIGQLNLNTSVSSQSGTLPGTPAGIVLLALSAYTFAWSGECDVGTINRWSIRANFAPLTPSADSPEWFMENTNNVAQLYASEWRHIDP